MLPAVTQIQSRTSIEHLKRALVFSNLFFLSSVNKRLDEWVTEDYLDTRKVQFPRKDGSTTGHNTGVTTPKKLVPNSTGPLAANSSRPASPKSEADNELVNGNTVMAAALQKKMNRKRKVCKQLTPNSSCRVPNRDHVTIDDTVFIYLKFIRFENINVIITGPTFVFF